jgi:hypothetical protein
MKEFKASTTINAAPEKVWAILTDTPAWPEWDPYCIKIEGQVALGAKLKAFNKLSPNRAFGVKVTELSPNQKMIWSGGMPFGLFKGERSFTLRSAGGGKTEFTLHEVFSGPMLKLIGGSIPDMSDAFREFAAGLKKRAEG